MPVGASVWRGAGVRLPVMRVPPEELVVAIAVVDVAAAQEAAGVLAHEQRQIGLLLHELLLVEPGVDDHLAHRQSASAASVPMRTGTW